jgi:hypothetical protein
MSFDLSNYVDVRSRIQMFREKYPNGSLQPLNHDKPYEVITVGDKQFVVYVACAYRSPDDTRPGVGTAMEPIPGRTPYTKDSELMNAETSAWGRAIVAALAVDHLPAIASQEEVRNRQTTERVIANGDWVEVPATVSPIKQPRGGAPASGISKPLSADTPASTKQKSFVQSILKKLELSDLDCKKLCGQSVEDLTMTTAKKLLDDLLAVQRGNASMTFTENDIIIERTGDAS